MCSIFSRFATRRGSVTKVWDKIGKFSVRMLSTVGKAGYPHFCAYPLDLKHDETDPHFRFLFPNAEISQFAGPGEIALFQWNLIGADCGQRWSINLEHIGRKSPSHGFAAE